MHKYQQSNVVMYGDEVYGTVAATSKNLIRPIELLAPEELGLAYGASNTPLQKGWAMRDWPIAHLA